MTTTCEQKAHELLAAIETDDAMLLAALHDADPQIAAATLELCSYNTRTMLFGFRVIDRHPDDSTRHTITALGWDIIAQLALRWNEEQLIEYFGQRVGLTHTQRTEMVHHESTPVHLPAICN